MFAVYCVLAQGVFAQKPKPTPQYGGEIQKSENEFLDFNFKPGRQSDTLFLIEQQNRKFESGARDAKTTQDAIDTNKAKAEQMVNLIKDEELQKAFAKITVRGKQILQENQELQSPLAVIAGAATLWYGRTIRLIRNESFQLSTRVDGRNRSGDFSLQSPLMNGRLRFQNSEGFDISMNRRISSIDTEAELNYNMNNQSFSTELRHKLAPNVDFTFGASQLPSAPQTDGRAGVQYRLDF